MSEERHFPDPKEAVEKYYTVTNEVLGSGYFATVKVGIKKDNGEKVAVKVIEKVKVAESPHLLENEILIMKKIHHTNIVSLQGVFDTPDALIIVMELMRGGELYEKIVEKKHFSEKDASYLMRQVFHALEYLHSIGVVHRDLKLENMLLVNKDGLEMKLADFGLSKLYSGQALQTACGTPFYVAPDILLGTGYGPGVDMWATGVLLYILLSGRLPFHADNDAALFQLILEGKLVFKSPQFDTVSKEAQDLIKHLLVVDPDKRYTAKQALEHPFIKHYDQADEKPLHASLYENLKKTSFISRQNIKKPGDANKKESD
jgi:calcium/calmodulin-dependent protein kinase I